MEVPGSPLESLFLLLFSMVEHPSNQLGTAKNLSSDLRSRPLGLWVHPENAMSPWDIRLLYYTYGFAIYAHPPCGRQDKDVHGTGADTTP